ncbi:hypothetical protein B566_EDAN004062 [Ephemera danica]|nr:hypothetical protein B566_EDAN004062 [Ephemera danica]
MSRFALRSRLTIYTPSKPPDTPEKGKFDGFIPIDKLDITYSRSSGPGGQNVNTVSTKVDLRVHIATADWMHPDIKAKMLEEHKTKINKEGFLIIRSDKTRSQQLNLADAMSKLREMLWNAAQPTNKEATPETLEKLRRSYTKID